MSRGCALPHVTLYKEFIHSSKRCNILSKVNLLIVILPARIFRKHMMICMVVKPSPTSHDSAKSASCLDIFVRLKAGVPGISYL